MKHGVVSINAEGVASFTENAGALGYITDAVSTVFSTTKAPVGYTAVVQRVALLAAGNMLATQSTTGKLGVSALGRTIAFGR